MNINVNKKQLIFILDKLYKLVKMIGKVTVTIFVAICVVMLIELGQCNPAIGKKYGNYALFIPF